MARKMWSRVAFFIAAVCVVHTVGASWKVRSDSEGFPGRHTGGVTVMNDKVWMLGGGTCEFPLALSPSCHFVVA
eukprot:2431321-Rhodomonas_salina.1